jgi:hypothetical protein
MEPPHIIEISDDDDTSTDEFIVAIDIGLKNFAYSIFDKCRRLFVHLERMSLPIQNHYLAEDISNACKAVVEDIRELISNRSRSYSLMILIEHQMVKGGKYSIHGSIVTQKCIKPSFHSYFKVLDYPIFTIYPRKVSLILQSTLLMFLAPQPNRYFEREYLPMGSIYCKSGFSLNKRSAKSIVCYRYHLAVVKKSHCTGKGICSIKQGYAK